MARRQMALPPIALKPDDAIIQDMTCTICCGIAFHNPVVTTTCEHVFCKPCIEQSIRCQQQEVGGEGLVVSRGVCPNDYHPLSVKQLNPLSGILRRMWEKIAVKCPSKECTWTGTMGNYSTHADRYHSNNCSTKSHVALEAEVAHALTMMTTNSNATSTMTLPSITKFDFSNAHYDLCRAVELALWICQYLKHEPDEINQNRIFQCVQNCYSCYKRPDPSGDDNEFHNQLEYHKVLRLLLGACISSTWFTYKQKRSFKLWARYVNANDVIDDQ